jgi:hypothetical protein
LKAARSGGFFVAGMFHFSRYSGTAPHCAGERCIAATVCGIRPQLSA